MAVITKFGNQGRVDLGVAEKDYYDVLSIANSFSLNTGVTPFTVSSRIIKSWDVNTPLSAISIVATSTHAGMTTEAQWLAALADLSKLVTV